MLNFKQYNFKNYNIWLVIIATLLSSISIMALKLAGKDDFFPRQIFGLVLGLMLVALISIIDYHFIARFVAFYYVVIVVILFLTVFSPLGTDNGTSSYRWINLGFMQLQPSELAKITLILVLSVLFTRMEERMEKVSTLIVGGIVMAVPTSLILIQSDLSSSLVMMFIFAIMIFAAGLSFKIVGTVLAIGVPSFVAFIWYILQPGQTLLEEYQVGRIVGFLNPEKYKLHGMFQQYQSIQAIASGRVYGKFLTEGPSPLRSYNSVGVRESDFIWSILGEEFGFIGGCVIIGLLCSIIIICLLTARKAKDRIGRLMAIGVSAMFMFQVFANIGVASMILPNTGLPLPFLSYGLSSLISSMIAIGLILNIGLQQKNNVRG